MNRSLFVILLLACGLPLWAQQADTEHDGRHSHLHAHTNEIGMANAPVYYLKEKTISYGLHLHYLHQLGDRPWAIGLGYERIFDTHEHQTIGPVIAYRFDSHLTVAASPGATFEHDEDHALFAMHLEAAYEWDLGLLHLGPNAEIAYDPEDIHLSLGLHIGFDL